MLPTFLDTGLWSTPNVRNGTVLLLSGAGLFPLPPAFRVARGREAPSDGLAFVTGSGKGSFELPHDLNSLPFVGSVILDALVVVFVLACVNFPSASAPGALPSLSGGDCAPKTWEGNPENDDLSKVKHGEFPVGGFMFGTQSLLTASADDARGDEDPCTSDPGKKFSGRCTVGGGTSKSFPALGIAVG